MTDEVKKMIGGLPKYDPHQISKYSHERAMSGLKSKPFIRESDVIELVESLMKWNKVEDCLPNNGDNVQVNHELIEATFLHGEFIDVDDGYVMDVYEWRNIIE